MDIKIRHIEPADYLGVHAVYTCPKVIVGTLQLPYPSADGWRKRLENKPEGLYLLLAEIDAEIVATLGMDTYPLRPRRRHVANLGMGVKDDWQGKGVASQLMEAALDLGKNWLNIKRFELSVYTDNPAAVALYKKFAFEIEGTHQAFALRDGEFVDAYSMALLIP